MTSYPFLKLAAATAKYYFRFRICYVTAFRRSKSTGRPNFVQISQLAAEIITTCGFEIQTSVILEFDFRFRSWPFCRNRRVILHPAAEFRPNRNIRRWNMTSYRDFQDGGRQPCCVCFGAMADHPRSAFRGLNSDLKSLVRRINSSGDIAM